MTADNGTRQMTSFYNETLLLLSSKVVAVSMGELPSNLGYVCWHGSCGASATQLRHKCDANVSVICISSFRSCFYYFLWRRPVCSREEVLYTARLKHWFHSENNVQVKDAQTWVMLKTNSYKNKVASFAFQNGLLYNYSAEVCVEYQCWFQQYKILIKSLQLLSLHVLTLRSGICCQVHQAPCCLRIYINLHLSDR